MKNTRTSIIAFVFFLLVSSSASAQEVSSGSGTTEPTPEPVVTTTQSRSSSSIFSLQTIQQQEIEKQWQARIQRSEDFRQQWLQEKRFMNAFFVSEDQYHTRRTIERAQCRANIRLASKYDKTYTTFDCYRDELASNLERLQKQREFVERVPGVSDDVRWLTLTRMDLLSDALAVIINAINSDVYQTLEELEEAKYNLMISYRKPMWTMMTRVRADKMLTWTASLMTRIGSFEDDEMISPAAADKLYEAVQCLSETEVQLDGVLASQEFEAADINLLNAYDLLGECITIIREAEELNVVEEVSAAEETPAVDTGSTIEVRSIYSQEDMLSRRLQSRLDEAAANNTTDSSNSTGTHAAASDKPVNVSDLLADDPSTAETAAMTCGDQAISRRLARRIGETCNLAN